MNMRKITASFLIIHSLWAINGTLGFSQTSTASVSVHQAFLHKQTADRYLRNGEISSAISEYQKAISLSPRATSTYFNLAIAYYSKKDLDRAASALKILVSLDPNDVEALYNLACLELCLQKVEEAKLRFEQAKLCGHAHPAFAYLIENGLEFTNSLIAS